jgi:xanthine dehydrogenase accessory factor
MNRQILDALLASIEQRESVALVSVTEAGGAAASLQGKHLLVWPDPARAPLGDLEIAALGDTILDDVRQAIADREHRHLSYTWGGEPADAGETVKVFVEVQAQPPHLIIVGAGHIAVPLATVAMLCDFEVTVLDDRPQYAHPDRFPTAQRVIAGPFRAELQKLRATPGAFGPHTSIVLVTRGHQYDVESLLEVLDDPLGYIGMIGSRRRIRAVFELLEQEQGVPPAKFDRVYAPIGIDIGARTPGEIAVCIMAEIINVMRKGPAQSLSDQIRAERQARRDRAAAHHSAAPALSSTGVATTEHD